MLKSKLKVSILISSLTILVFSVIDKFNFDLLVSGFIYDNHGWNKGKESLWIFFYDWGPIPSILSGLICLFFWFYKKIVTKAENVRSTYLLFPFLTLLVGPGLLVNFVGKELWGRPRPVNCIELGGEHNFQKVLKINSQNHHKSFPSGHAAVGFHICALAVFLCGKWRIFSFMGFLAWGSLVSIARVLQGGHFVSDIVGSIAIMILTFVILYPYEDKHSYSTNKFE